MDTPASSASQDHWKEITEAVRNGLAKVALRMPEMSPGDLKLFVEAVDMGMWLEVRAANQDAAVDQHKRFLERPVWANDDE
jgi:hypothetical protein